MKSITVLPSAGPGTSSLELVAGSDPPRYRATKTLSFALGAGVDGAEIGSAVLRGSFNQRDVVLPRGSGAGQANVASGSGGLIVTLPERRVVHQVTLTAGGSAGLTHLAFHRLDGSTPSDSATRQDAISASTHVATVGGPFADVRFLMKPVPVLPFATSAVVSVTVRGLPTGPRIGLADPSAPDDVVFFWQEPGEHASPFAVDAGPAFAAALQSHLEERLAGAGDDDEVAVTLVFESEAPASVVLGEALAASFRTIARPLPDGETKLVLRFPGTAGFTQDFTLPLPPTGNVSSATLWTTPSFRGKPTDPAGGGGEGSGSGLPASSRGALLEEGRWVGQRIPLDGSVSVEGVLLAVRPLEPGSEVRVELREDRDGLPSGAALAELVLPAEGMRPTWLRGLPRGGATLRAPAAWIFATAARGSLVWLADNEDPPVRVFDASESGGPVLAGGRDLPGTRCLHRLMEPRDRSAGGPDGGADERLPFTLSIGVTEIARLPASGGDPEGRVSFDLGGALASTLAAADPSATEPREVRVAVSALSPGILTVYAPDIRLEE